MQHSLSRQPVHFLSTHTDVPDYMSADFLQIAETYDSAREKTLEYARELEGVGEGEEIYFFCTDRNNNLQTRKHYSPHSPLVKKRKQAQQREQELKKAPRTLNDKMEATRKEGLTQCLSSHSHPFNPVPPSSHYYFFSSPPTPVSYPLSSLSSLLRSHQLLLLSSLSCHLSCCLCANTSF